MSEKWVVGHPGGPSGPFWSVVSSSGKIIALQIPDESIALLLANLNNCDFDFVDETSKQLVKIIGEQLPGRSPIEDGTHHYVVRSVFEALLYVTANKGIKRN